MNYNFFFWCVEQCVHYVIQLPTLQYKKKMSREEKLIYLSIVNLHYVNFVTILWIGRRKYRQRKIGNSGSRTELPNLNDHEAVQR